MLHCNWCCNKYSFMMLKYFINTQGFSKTLVINPLDLTVISRNGRFAELYVSSTNSSDHRFDCSLAWRQWKVHFKLFNIKYQLSSIYTMDKKKVSFLQQLLQMKAQRHTNLLISYKICVIICLWSIMTTLTTLWVSGAGSHRLMWIKGHLTHFTVVCCTMTQNVVTVIMYLWCT